MAYLNETPVWEEYIRMLELTDPVLGGEDGPDNIAPRQLANRTAWLKAQIELLLTKASIPATDFNDCVENGFYIVNGNTHAPTTQSTRWAAFVFNATASACVQLATYYSTSNKDLFFRTLKSGIWSDWAEIANKAYVDDGDTRLQNRPLTTDIHDWMPASTDIMVYGLGVNITNAPDAKWWRYIGMTHNDSRKYVTLLAMPIDSSSNRLLIKTCNRDTWSGWREFAGKDDLGVPYMTIPSSGLPNDWPEKLSFGRVYGTNGYPCAYGTVWSFKGASYDVTQILVEWRGVTGATGNMWFRNARDNSNVFSDWTRVATDADVDKRVLKSGDTMTGRLKLANMGGQWINTTGGAASVYKNFVADTGASSVLAWRDPAGNAFAIGAMLNDTSRNDHRILVRHTADQVAAGVNAVPETLIGIDAAGNLNIKGHVKTTDVAYAATATTDGANAGIITLAADNDTTSRNKAATPAGVAAQVSSTGGVHMDFARVGCVHVAAMSNYANNTPVLVALPAGGTWRGLILGSDNVVDSGDEFGVCGSILTYNTGNTRQVRVFSAAGGTSFSVNSQTGGGGNSIVVFAIRVA